MWRMKNPEIRAKIWILLSFFAHFQVISASVFQKYGLLYNVNFVLTQIDYLDAQKLQKVPSQTILAINSSDGWSNHTIFKLLSYIQWVIKVMY